MPVKEQIFPKVEEAEEPETLLYEPQAPEGVGPDVVAAQDSLQSRLADDDYHILCTNSRGKYPHMCELFSLI